MRSIIRRGLGYGILLGALVLVFGCRKDDATDSVVVRTVSLDSLDVDALVGQTVGEALQRIKEDYVDYVFFDEPPGNLLGCKIYYPEGKRLYLYTYRLEHVERVNPRGEWSFEAYKKERIGDVKLKNEG